VLPQGAGLDGLVGASRAGGAWRLASELAQLRAGAGVPIVMGQARSAAVRVEAGGSIFGAVTNRSWVATAGSQALPAQTVGGLATIWRFPPAATLVRVGKAGSAGQHLADLGMLAIWAVGLAVAWRGRRPDTLARLARAHLETGPGEEVLDIDWSSLVDGQNVG